MTDRPYRSVGIDELEAIVTKNWNEQDALQAVANELNHRHTGRALRLLRKVEQRISELEPDGEAQGGAEPTEMEILFARVGLHPSAPDFLLKAARKAYRTNYHPDKHSAASSDKQREAEEAFKEIDNIFDEIESLQQ